MKPHPRIRKTIKWGGAAVTAALTALWTSSEYTLASYHWQSTSENAWRQCCIALESGRASISWSSVDPHAVTSTVGVVAAGPPEWLWGFDCAWGRRWFFLAVPLWAPMALAAGCTLATSRCDAHARRRARMNLCPKCRYDRTGLATAAPCTECGASPQS